MPSFFRSRPVLHLDDGASGPAVTTHASSYTSVSSTIATRRPNADNHARRISSSAVLPPPTPDSSSFKGAFSSPFRPINIPSRIWWRARRLATKPLIWLIVLLFGLSAWWSTGGGVASPELQSVQMQARLREFFPAEVTKDLQLFPASNSLIHYVGRWTPAPNRLRIDGAFPGVYFDLNITNTTSVILSLQNTPEPALKPTDLPGGKLKPKEIPHAGQYSFAAASRLLTGAAPVSLMALVDQEEYVMLPNSTGLVAVRMRDLNPRLSHTVRVIAPMTDNAGTGIVQLDGIWLDSGGELLPVEGSLADKDDGEMDAIDAEFDGMGKKSKGGLGDFLRGTTPDEAPNLRAPSQLQYEEGDGETTDLRRRKKLVEIVTDDPAHISKGKASGRSGGSDGLLAGVMGWEYLLGEMFSIDHVCIGVEGMCLLQDCVGGAGAPSSLGDVFFRSGPVGSPHFGHPWPFQSYAPDVLIFNLGASDFYSIVNNVGQYNRTGAELFRAFEDTYVSLIKAVRSMAYPNHPAIIEMQRLGLDAYADYNTPAAIPIFIMRPFSGEMEHATQGAVNRVRAEGDKSVFWLDTSGWLDPDGTETKESDFFKDDSVDPPKFHLTERGNQKVAIYLHMHVCRYLASTDENCAFLPPDVYQGTVFDPSLATFERYIENEKERQVKEMFWEPET